MKKINLMGSTNKPIFPSTSSMTTALKPTSIVRVAAQDNKPHTGRLFYTRTNTSLK